ncbi:hypothetical protein A3K34_04585 [candidate division WWE3 bacterium RIFOXYC1_FULL_40_10]|uniref:Phosphoribosyltransferase domain-containing protein n=1 Tax=candidate division WWE3 bacterium RIFOXYA2_FULL_46_9 TaxID=1802636 RepID=A0A1F4W127_UNCKA|nr:MAG: hypothetical protein A3K58_04585 [candidate division WWE3 bacterium RIFOXYB1_FULL_40_22]OGC62119.1 MAG: hypothetical protein A3K37_04585 [candidate division WWE3 bacterium RIFOXYA1_FULL_40_11]OGC63132.1 MAG: hypothetical protein A2264_00330 [candidate division WWE3 bacterium RIFOXYA2_FULL_46_9]OGC64938.1 MAG: hypothetical protein A2326_02780 [candidate division WWE3 bacterium RIFOXYB2_FULL_41_6]OGC66502.1 MAG: hypothetical protein A3K34_04585 [candidate division WWE3 bacterium RIFOXYC1_
MENLLNLIFPPKCLFCSSTGAIFCEVCLGKCVVLNQIETLKNQGFNFELKLLSIFSYEGLVRLCIKKSKYQAKQFAALKVLASRGVTYLKPYSSFFGNFYVMAVPPSENNLSKRGFNQADVIVHVLAKNLPIRTFSKNPLHRLKATVSQHSKSRVERFNTLKDAFWADASLVAGKNILLVDDICTSGATFFECAKALKRAGVKSIGCFALSRRLL